MGTHDPQLVALFSGGSMAPGESLAPLAISSGLPDCQAGFYALLHCLPLPDRPHLSEAKISPFSLKLLWSYKK